jgi:VanZ family protein
MIRKNLLSIAVALVIMFLSMANSHSFDKIPTFNIPHFDKIVHFSMYFGLMLTISFENRRNLTNFKNLATAALVPLLYGIIIEILQATLTTTRSGSVYDALADLAGIIVALMIWFLLKPVLFKESDTD